VVCAIHICYRNTESSPIKKLRKRAENGIVYFSVCVCVYVYLQVDGELQILSGQLAGSRHLSYHQNIIKIIPCILRNILRHVVKENRLNPVPHY
jgi:hypothetical protein